MMQNKERRKNSTIVPYVFFFFELLFILEIAYIYVALFGTSPYALIPLALLTLFAFYKALNRLTKVLKRIHFANYNFTAKKKNN